MAKTENNENKEVDDLDLESQNQDETKVKADKKAAGNDFTISSSKLVLIKNLLENISECSEKIRRLLSGMISPEDEARISIGQMGEAMEGLQIPHDVEVEEGGRIIEGVFDGENMIGPDGKQYSVPANYASKSKLVEGDILKLTITGTGTFVYKQIGPIERKRVVGKLEQTSSGGYLVHGEDKKWRVLTASVTYFKGKNADEVVVLVPKAGESKWAAVENIVKSAK